MTPLNRAVRTAASVGVAAALATVGLPGPSAGAGPPEAAPGPVLDAPAGLAAALAARDTTAYLRRLDAALAADLVARLPADERPDIPAWDVGLVARSLQPGSALLALLPDDDRVWAALVRPDGVVPRRLNAPHVNALGPRLVAWAEDPAARPLDRRAALTLHNNLLVPFQEELSDVRHLVVAASGVLRTLPFEILLMAPADDDQPVSGLSFLVRRFELAYEPTIGSRLGWSGRPGDVRRVRRAALDAPEARVLLPGTLVAVAGAGTGGSAAEALGWLREGASACLLGGEEAALDEFLRRFYRERAGGRRPVVRAVHRTRLALLSAGAPPEAWARPLLFGAD